MKTLPSLSSVGFWTPPVDVGLPPNVARVRPTVLMTWRKPRRAFSLFRLGGVGSIELLS